MSDFYIKKNDTLPLLTATLKDADGVAVNLTGSAVKFHMRLGNAVAKVNATATIVSAAAGTVKYIWVTGDTDTKGVYSGEWQVTFGDGTILTFPNKDYFSVEIDDELA
jgi:hypothetical protein